MIRRNSPLSIGGNSHRQSEFLSQPDHIIARILRPTTRDQHRLMRRPNHLRCYIERGLLWLMRRAMRGFVNIHIRFLLKYIQRNLQNVRPRPTVFHRLKAL